MGILFSAGKLYILILRFIRLYYSNLPIIDKTKVLTSPDGADIPQIVLGFQILLCMTALYSVINCFFVRFVTSIDSCHFYGLVKPFYYSLNHILLFGRISRCRIPVIYINAYRKSENTWSAVLTSACDFLTVYSIVYLVLTINSIWASNHHLQALLLLDVITKSRTTRDTLMAIWKPRFTIFMAMVLMFIFCFIYSVFYVSYPCFHIRKILLFTH